MTSFCSKSLLCSSVLFKLPMTDHPVIEHCENAADRYSVLPSSFVPVNFFECKVEIFVAFSTKTRQAVRGTDTLLLIRDASPAAGCLHFRFIGTVTERFNWCELWLLVISI